MASPMVSPSRPDTAIRLGFPRPYARRQGISVHHQLQGRLHRVAQARGPESERDKKPRECHTSRHAQVVLGRRHRTGARHDHPAS